MPAGSKGEKLRSKRKVEMTRIAMPPVESISSSSPAVNLEDKFVLQRDGQLHVVRADSLVRIKEIGRGGYGIVETMWHAESNTIFAVKRIPLSVNDEIQKRMLIELNASMKSGSCPFMVRFYGAMFREGDVWFCMEAMDTSMDRFYKMCNELKRPIPEFFLSRVAHCLVEALRYMKEELNLMHRDVKPSNILLSRKGEIKICDFGISGHLTDSLAKTVNAGCKPYMAPERINPQDEAMHGYDVRSDIWSLGITLIELATANHPYGKWKTPFEQLKQVVMEPPPALPDKSFSGDFQDFVGQCLKKDYRQRPKYFDLSAHPFLKQYDGQLADVAAFVVSIFDQVGVDDSLPTIFGKLRVNNDDSVGVPETGASASP